MIGETDGCKIHLSRKEFWEEEEGKKNVKTNKFRDEGKFGWDTTEKSDECRIGDKNDIDNIDRIGIFW